MPEGHTLRRLADDLTAAFGGRVVSVTSPGGKSVAEASAVDGAELVSADSAGKHLFLEFVGERFIHIHLGLIGKFDLFNSIPGEPTGLIRMRLFADGPDPVFADLRGATRCDLIGLDRRSAVIAQLGPDPLRPDADPLAAWVRIRKSRKTIGELLMDQSVLAGVGNVYRAEVLFRHGIHPLRKGSSLQRKQWLAIWQDLVELMAEGVRVNRIDTVRPEHTPEAMGRPPRRDDHGGEVYVYRRTDQGCFVCGSRIKTAILVGRNSFWCGNCQRAPRS